MLTMANAIKKKLYGVKGIESVRVVDYEDAVHLTVFHQEFLTNPLKSLRDAIPRCQLKQQVTPIGRQCVSKFVVPQRQFLLTELNNLIAYFIVNHHFHYYPDVTIRRDEHDYRVTKYGCCKVFHDTRR